MTGARLVLLISIAIGLFVLLIVHNLANGWGQHVARLQAQITAAKQTISAVRTEQAALAKEVRSVASALQQKQNIYEAKMARENDEKLKSVWRSYKLGLVLNRGQVLKIENMLDALRTVTDDLVRTAFVELEDIQRVVSDVGSSAKSSRDTTTIKRARDRIDELQGVIAVAIQLVAQTRIEVAEQQDSLEEQRRKIQALYPAGSSMANPLTRGITEALEAALRDNEKAQDLLERFDKSVTGFGKAVFSISDILKAQGQSLDAVSSSTWSPLVEPLVTGRRDRWVTA